MSNGTAICWRFQSTRPSRGATRHILSVRGCPNISIHAPLAGRDHFLSRPSATTGDFNPRAPRGARPPVLENLVPIIQFQSTRPSRGATSRHCSPVIRLVFQSTRPSRGATIGRVESVRLRPISIHAPLAGRDAETAASGASAAYFNPRAPRGARQQMCTKITYIFALIHKRNTFSCQTPSVRALSKKLSGRFSHKIRCEPPCKTLCAAAPHYTISVPSGRYVCLQPKCSILLSYFFPK